METKIRMVKVISILCKIKKGFPYTCNLAMGNGDTKCNNPLPPIAIEPITKKRRHIPMPALNYNL
jgi:hypothetical protein